TSTSCVSGVVVSQPPLIVMPSTDAVAYLTVAENTYVSNMVVVMVNVIESSVTVVLLAVADPTSVRSVTAFPSRSTDQVYSNSIPLGNPTVVVLATISDDVGAVVAELAAWQ